MLLKKDGVTIDPQHPSDIAKYKFLGFKEVESQEPDSAEKVLVEKPKTVRTKRARKPSKAVNDGTEG